MSPERLRKISMQGLIGASFMMLLIVAVPFIWAAPSGAEIPSFDNKDLSWTYDPAMDPLVKAGFRPRFPYPGSPFIQTPAPMPEGAYMLPYGQVPKQTASSQTRATWTLYYTSTEVDVYVDTSSSGGGSLSPGERDQLNRIIDDFRNISFPRVKDYFDPSNIVDHVDFRVHKIDGPSGVGGYYQPGTNEFNMDRDDMSWGGEIAAHEFEHYVHRQYDPYENLWVDEGCADYATYLVYGFASALSSHVYAFLEYRPQNTLTISDSTFYNDYTTSYYGSSFMFQFYMASHYGGADYTRALVRSTSQGTNGVTRALQVVGSSDNFAAAFAKWKVATRVNDDNAGDGTTYSYPVKSYPYGSLTVPVTAGHSGVPAAATRNIGRFSITTIRFSSPPDPSKTYRLKLSFSDGTPDVQLYMEKSAPRPVVSVDFSGGTSVNYDFTGWGGQYNNFQAIVSSSADSSFSYDLDLLDLLPPVTTISLSPSLPDGEDGWYVTSPRIIFNTEANAQTRYSLDGGAEQDYSGPLYLNDGQHNLSYYSIDRHGNREAFNFKDLKVDMTFPSSNIQVDPDMPEDQWLAKGPTITLSTPYPDAVVEYKWGNDAYQTYTQPLKAPEGQSTFFWRAVDLAGNREEEASRGFRVDSIPPVMEYSIYPASPNGENGWYKTEPQITLTSKEKSAIYYAIDNADISQYISPFEVKEGTHTVKFYSIDQAGNKGAETRLEVKVDTITPTLTGTFDSFEYTVDNSSKWLNFAPILTVQSSEQKAIVNYSINGGTPRIYDGQIESLEGLNDIWVYAKDPAGNVAGPLNYVIRVDLRKPFVETKFDKPPTDGWYRDSDVTLQLISSTEDDRSSPVKLSYRWGGGSDTIFRSTIKVPEGRNTLTYWAEDMAGNKMDPRTIEVKKDSIDPLIQVDAGGQQTPEVFEGGFIEFDLTGSTDESGTPYFGLDREGSGEIDWSVIGQFNETFPEAGTHNLTFYVKDGAGNIQSKVVMVKVKELPPEKGQEVNDSSTTLIIIGAAIGVLVLIIIVILEVFLIIRKRQQEQQILKAHPHLHHGGHHPAYHHHGHNPAPIGIPPPPIPPKAK